MSYFCESNLRDANSYPNYVFLSSLLFHPTGAEIVVFDTLPSTNEFAINQLSKTLPSEGTVIFTWNQTQGRGQIGRSWHSETGKNCSCSVILYPKIRPKEQFYLNMVISLGILDFLSDTSPGNWTLKWPNDIYFGHSKMGGILLHNVLQGDRIVSTVAGIGLNINQTTFPDWIPNPVSLSLITGREWDVLQLLQSILLKIHQRYLLLQEGNFSGLKEDYEAVLYGLNTVMDYRHQGEEQVVSGILRGVNALGQLKLEINGEIGEFNMGELSLIQNRKS